ncbi:MAG TPA: helix-turn-helix transcriptional regulator [Candidatus Merdicola faecigallinarum]|uniref:Helix-turn-helix transcriptional regulator n=1 Tax=Candidatus Merdicola faecigallinarum TaxID=2840862 RepID=A0A9D1M0H3_9FIRM|nr:helix-turn-helix transcriptional regulator [Candidatus Merdicola faecigallinarum]
MEKQTKLLRYLILLKYESIRAFAKLIEVPYSTVCVSLKRGIDRTSIKTVIKICSALEINIDDLVDERFDKLISPEIEILIQNAKHLSNNQVEEIQDFIHSLN